MYFWSALIALGVVGLSLLGVALWAMLAVVVLVVVGVVAARAVACHGRGRAAAGPVVGARSDVTRASHPAEQPS